MVAVPWCAPAGAISILSRAQPASFPARGAAASPPGSPSGAEADAQPAELFFPDRRFSLGIVNPDGINFFLKFFLLFFENQESVYAH